MKSDESFERDVRAALRAGATEAAPDELVTRVGEIPTAERASRRGIGRLRLVGRLAVNLAAAAVVVVAVAALIVIRNGNQPVGGLENPTGGLATPSLSAAPSGASACDGPALPNATAPGPAGSAPAARIVVVTLGIYSGRADPTWALTVDQAASIDGALAALPDETGTPPVGGLGYHGFTILDKIRGSSLVAYAGAVAAPGDGPRSMKADPTMSIERCLLETSRSHVTAVEYATAEAAIAAPTAPSPGASTTPAPSATPGAPTPLLGLSPVSVTFVSADDGWVLGRGACPGGTCAAITRTADGGRTWAAVAAPNAAIVPAPGQGNAGISGLRFADQRNGWAFGPDLWATHDGGATWTRLTIAGAAADAAVAALETAGGTVHAVVLDGSTYRVASSPVGADDFRFAAVPVPVGAGPVPSVQLVLAGTAGWLLENDRTVVGGARLVNGAWATWQPPCADVVGPAFLAASGPGELVAACDEGLWGTPAGERLYLSHDGGATFARVGASVPLQMAAGATTVSPTAIVVGGSDATGQALVATFDGGRTWAVVARLGAVDIADLGFTTPVQGVVVSTPADGPGSLLMTRDGGHTWRAVGTPGG